jgi:hypothetical protein
MKRNTRTFVLSLGNELNTKSKWYEDSKYSKIYNQTLNWYLYFTIVMSLGGSESYIGRSLFNPKKIIVKSS